MKSPAIEGRRKREQTYVLEDQVGFLLRQAHQRHTTIFATEMIEELTPTQWAALAKLTELGACSQNHLGRQTAMDAATIKGVIDRLTGRGFTTTGPDPLDGRRLLVALTRAGVELTNARRRSLRSSLKRRSNRWTNTNARRSSLCCGASPKLVHEVSSHLIRRQSLAPYPLAACCGCDVTARCRR